MRTIICIWHYAQKGKTKTILEFTELLKKEYPCCKVIYHQKEETEDDFQEVIKIEGATIGIESMGDPRSGLGDKLEKMNTDYPCNLIICASRVEGITTADAVSDFAKENNFDIIWTSTYDMENKTEQHDLANKLKAKHLLDLVKEFHLLSRD